MNDIQIRPTQKFEAGIIRSVHESIAVETRMNIALNNEYVETLYCSPNDLDALGVGLLIATGQIGSGGPTPSVTVENGNCRVFWNRNATAEPPLPQEITLAASLLFDCRDTLLKTQRIHSATGGAHAAILCDIKSKQTVMGEDISRHNAFDKVVGRAVLQNMNLHSSLVLITGRITHSLARRAIYAGIPVLASLAVATSGGIEVSTNNGLTILGSLTADSFWIYYCSPLTQIIDL